MKESTIFVMYGKHFQSMYTGSMVGSGALAFAVMGYVVANQVPDREVGSQVELNPIILGTVLGEDPKDVEKAIKFLCEKDPKSRTKTEDGRRLIRLGEYAYQVVNGAKYRAMMDEESRRLAARERKRQQREREKEEGSRKMVGGIPSYSERLQTKCQHDGEWVAGTLAGMERCVGCGLEREKVNPEEREIEPV